MANGTQMMWELLNQEQSQTQIVGVSDFLAKTLVSQGCSEDSLGIDHHSFSELCIFLENSGKEIDPNTCSLKMLKTLLVFTPALISEGYSLPWMRGGMMQNGELSTQKTMTFPKTGRECSLSDVLEEEVSERYFLSEQATKRLLSYKDSEILGQSIQEQEIEKPINKIESMTQGGVSPSLNQGKSDLNIISNALKVGGNNSVGTYLTDGGGVLKVNGYHKG